MPNVSPLVRLFLCCCLVWTSASSCTVKQAAPEPPPPPVPLPPSPPALQGGEMKLVVFRLENTTHPKRTDESREEDQLFGNGIKTQLINTLEQAGQFSIIDNPGPRKVLWSRAVSRSGMISAFAKQRFGSLGEAEFLVGGAITRYDLSEESKAAGIDADLFFRESQATAIDIPVARAKEVFAARPTAAQDRVVIELWLFDAKTGQRFATTWLEGSPDDSATAIGGLFGQYLASLPLPTPQTPMQRALRAITIKAVNWIAQQGLAFRAQPPPAPVPRVKRRPKPRPKSAPKSLPSQQEKKRDFGFEAKETPPPPPVPASREQWGDSLPTAPSAPDPLQQEWGQEQ